MPAYSFALMQAVPLSARRNPGAHKGTVEGAAPLLQLPRLDAEVARRLTRKRVRGLPELQALPPVERRDVLAFAGLTKEQVCTATSRREVKFVPLADVMAHLSVHHRPLRLEVVRLQGMP